MHSSRLGWLVLGLVACSEVHAAGPTAAPQASTPPTATPLAPPPATPTAPVRPAVPIAPTGAVPSTPEVTIELASVTLGNDCGARATAKRENAASALGRRACEQTSMQLSVRAGPGSASPAIQVVQVRLYDDARVLLGALVPGAAMVWSEDGSYRPWDQLIAPNQTLSVTYNLSSPDWSQVIDRYSKSYVLDVTLTVGGTERSLKKDVRVTAPTILPPNVKT